MKREFLMLAQTYKASKHAIGGWFLSEKLDGMRCFWDGGVSRGMLKKDVPWANNRKDDRYITLPVATGLWSRLGNVIHAPASFLDKLPKMPLDGELYRRGHRQDTMSDIKKIVPNEAAWADIEFFAFGIPCFTVVFEQGYLNSTNFENKVIDQSSCEKLIRTSGIKWAYDPFKLRTFHTTNVLLERICVGTRATHLPQRRLPFMQSEAEAFVLDELDRITAQGGEGVMLRNPDMTWEACRSHHLLKAKKIDDDEATVVGYITGRETDKGSKLLGMMGALVLDYKGIRLELSGFTEEERELGFNESYVLKDGELEPVFGPVNWAKHNPETECPEWIEATHFPRGTQVTFKYRGLSKDGVPQEARYWRKR